MRYILIVEDDPYISGLVKKYLGGLGNEIHVVQAFNLEQGDAMFEHYGADIFCAILGGRMGPDLTTILLARKMYEMGFPKIVISFSGDEKLQAMQMKNGCTHEFQKDKFQEMTAFIKGKLIDSSK